MNVLPSHSDCSNSIRQTSHLQDLQDLLRANLEDLYSDDISQGKMVLVRNPRGFWEVVDLRKLKAEKASAILESAIHEHSTEFPRSEQAVMSIFKERFDRVNLRQPSCEIRYNKLSISSIRTKKVLLHPSSGVLKPGRITLLLAPPGSGKSLFLKALAGQLDNDLKMHAEELTYNGVEFSKFYPQRTSAYIAQNDLHYPELTVQETLDFSGQVQGSKLFNVLLKECARREEELGIQPDPNAVALMKAMAKMSSQGDITTLLVLRALGLEGCKDTVIGNALLRGISGGQRKRVSTAECLVGTVRAFFCDEISTGLDATTTADMIRMFRYFAKTLDGTFLIALLQPAPEVFDLFQDVILLTEGRIVFHGNKDDVLPYFQSLGFDCPEYTATADFVQEVLTTSDQQNYWARGSYKPVGALEMEAHALETGHTRAEQLGEPFLPREGCNESVLTYAPYGRGRLNLLKCCLRRGITLEKRTLTLAGIRLIQTIFTAFLTSTMFLQLETTGEEDAYLFLAVGFFSVTFLGMNPSPDAYTMLAQLPAFYKQRNARLFPAWCFGLSHILIRIPWRLLDSFLWTIIVYWTVGFAPSFGRFIAFYAICFCTEIFSLTLYSALASLFRKYSITNAVQSFLILILVNTAGFVINPNSIPVVWNGVYRANPWAYWLQSIQVNELTSSNWNQTVSDSFLSSWGYSTSAGYSIVYISIFAWGFGAAVLNVSVMVFGLTYLNAPKERVHAATNDSPRSVLVLGGPPPQTQSSPIPFPKVSLAMKDLKYSVSHPEKGEIKLLKGITASFRPGVLTALMGASGAGKTTLLDCLANRKTGGSITGEILVGGQPMKANLFSRISGYVEQEDIHEPFATVHEALQFSARLRLPPHISKAESEEFVRYVMDLVELQCIGDSRVGTPGVSGLSMEQRKRLTLAVEFCASPSILFCDEPTSGLDSRAAAIVMRAIRNTVDTGRTVVCTIHQPSLAIFMRPGFDELLLLKPGGETIFFGSVHNDLIPYLESCPQVAPIQKGVNPADWMLDVTSPAMETKKGVNFARLFETSELYQRALTRIQALKEVMSEDTFGHVSQHPWHKQLKELLMRDSRAYYRDTSYNATRMVTCLLIAIVYGTLYFDQGTNYTTYTGIINISGAAFASVLFIGAVNAILVEEVTLRKRVVYYRERTANYYSCLAYTVSEALVELPYLLAQSIMYSCIVYWMIGFAADTSKFFWFFGVMFLTVTYFCYLGQALVHITPSLELASATFAVLLSCLQLFSGFLRARPQIPAGWIWAYWINPLSYTLYGLVGNQLSDVETLTKLPSGESITVKQYVANVYGFTGSFVPWTILFCFGFIPIFKGISYAGLRLIRFQNR